MDRHRLPQNSQGCDFALWQSGEALAKKMTHHVGWDVSVILLYGDALGKYYANLSRKSTFSHIFYKFIFFTILLVMCHIMLPCNGSCGFVGVDRAPGGGG